MDDSKNAVPRSRDSDEERLIPGWNVAADTQIVALGVLVVFLVLAGTFLWPRIFGGDSPTDLSTSARNPAAVTNELSGNPTIIPPVVTTVTEPTQSTDVLDPDLSPDVAAAVSTFDGVNGSANGTVAILAGFVGTTAESQQAAAAAAAVTGITSVDNRLVVLEESVRQAAEEANVGEATVIMDGTNATLRGVVSNELEAQTALLAAGAVEGITPPVTNELRILQPEVDQAVSALEVVTDGEFVVESDGSTLPVGRIATLTGKVSSEEAKAAAAATAAAIPGVTAVTNLIEVVGPTDVEITTDLNELFDLNPIQFRSGSDVILDESLPTLDQAVAILTGATGDIRLEVQGYTDTSGGTEANLRLSERRAAAVRQYLVEGGVNDASLTSKGFGETTEFGPELADNRRVRFALL
ncbi:MAG: BON domain-containing protein [Acidimicrobiales bacterium]|nr:BON domain-containing protein [Acidimicrobiales bacterium]